MVIDCDSRQESVFEIPLALFKCHTVISWFIVIDVEVQYRLMFNIDSIHSCILEALVSHAYLLTALRCHVTKVH